MEPGGVRPVVGSDGGEWFVTADRAGAGVSGEARVGGGVVVVLFTLTVEAVEPGARVRVWIQQSADTVAWDDLVAYPEATAPGAWTARVVADAALTPGIEPRLDGELAPNTVRALPLAHRFRVRWHVEGGSARFGATAQAIVLASASRRTAT